MDVDNPKRTQLMIERAKSGQPKLFEERDDSVVAKSSTEGLEPKHVMPYASSSNPKCMNARVDVENSRNPWSSTDNKRSKQPTP